MEWPAESATPLALGAMSAAVLLLLVLLVLVTRNRRLQLEVTQPPVAAEFPPAEVTQTLSTACCLATPSRSMCSRSWYRQRAGAWD